MTEQQAPKQQPKAGTPPMPRVGGPSITEYVPAPAGTGEGVIAVWTDGTTSVVTGADIADALNSLL